MINQIRSDILFICIIFILQFRENIKINLLTLLLHRFFSFCSVFVFVFENRFWFFWDQGNEALWDNIFNTLMICEPKHHWKVQISVKKKGLKDFHNYQTYLEHWQKYLKHFRRTSLINLGFGCS